MISNLLDPAILCFIVGLASGVARSDLRLPKSTYEFVSLYLLLAIGLKGGVELSQTQIGSFLPALMGTMFIGFLTPIMAFYVLFKIGRFSREDSGAIAAHYGSVSAVTFATTLTYLELQRVSFEPYMTALMVVLEVPAICIGIYLAKGGLRNVPNRKKLFRDIFLGKSLFLLGGGLLIGYMAGPVRMEPLNPLFIDMFKGFLALFLLELGVVTARQLPHLKRVGFFLLAFAILMPISAGIIGVFVSKTVGLSLGGATILAVLAASSSYIAAPSAMRISVPEAKEVYYLSSSLGVTFPLNITLGIPFFYWFATLVY